MPGSECAPPVVSDGVLADLRARARSFRRVGLPAADGWSMGVDVVYFDELLAAWADGYEWGVVEARVRALPWVVAGRGKVPLRVVHQRAANPDAVAVVLLHGWPDSVMRFEKVLPMLTDVHVVVPALPGYPFAVPVSSRGGSAAAMSTAVAAAMADLGYDQYLVSGGDVGTDVAESLAASHPDCVLGLHLTDCRTITRWSIRLPIWPRRNGHISSGCMSGTPSRAATTISNRPGRTRWPSAWAIHPRAWPRGSWTSSTGGPTAAVTWKRCSPPRGRTQLGHCVLGHRDHRYVLCALRIPRTVARTHHRTDRVHDVPR